MTVLEQLISAWNQFATENSYQEIIYENESFEEVVRQIYGDKLTPARRGQFSDGLRKWFIHSRSPLVVDSVRRKPWWMFYRPHSTD